MATGCKHTITYGLPYNELQQNPVLGTSALPILNHKTFCTFTSVRKHFQILVLGILTLLMLNFLPCTPYTQYSRIHPPHPY